jgi:hypothetical protein
MTRETNRSACAVGRRSFLRSGLGTSAALLAGEFPLQAADESTARLSFVENGIILHSTPARCVACCGRTASAGA